MWIDTSKMNSRYRQMPLQGLGGGGVFGQDVLGSSQNRATSYFKPGPRGAMGATSSPIPFCNPVADERVKTFQRACNAALSKRGYEPLAVDGQLGPATCGAWAMLGDSKHNLTDAEWRSFPLDVVLSVVNCASNTLPTKVGASKPDTNTTVLTGDEYALPWRVPTAAAAKTQSDINQELVGHNYYAVPSSGMLDAPTCGAFRLAKDAWGLQYLHVFGKNCQAFEDPKPMPPNMGHQPASDPKKASMMVLGLVGAALLGVGAVAYSQRRKRSRS